MNPSPSSDNNPENATPSADTARGGQGFFGKPFIEQLKLLAVFIFAGVVLYFSKPTIPSLAVGSVFVIVGTLIRVWAGGHLTRDQRLTTSGPYQFTRNPFYLGRLLWIIGFAIMSGMGVNFSDWRNIVLWAVVIIAIFVFFAYYMPRKEAREGGRLAKLFPEDYMRWKENVPSLFPRFTPYVMNPRPWNKDLYMGNSAEFMGNKEVWTTLVVVILMVLFYARFLVLPAVTP
jgi:protein-S-isoprenylcysteine O-methyltransferase Ste14